MKKRPFFFHNRLGYRRNPFGALTEAEWIAIAVLPDAIANLSDTRFTHIQLLGPKGSGKTTALLKLKTSLAEAGFKVAYEYLAEGEKRLKANPSGSDIFFLDEAQRLSWLSKRRLLTVLSEKAGDLKFIFSSHTDLASLFGRQNLPLVTVRLEETLTLNHYRKIVFGRLSFFAVGDSPGTTLSQDGIRYLYDTFYPDFREAEYFLYDVWQQETAVRELTAVDLENYYSIYLRNAK